MSELSCESGATVVTPAYHGCAVVTPVYYGRTVVEQVDSFPQENAMSCDTQDIIELFIGDNNRIRQQIVAPADSANPGPVLGAAVAYTIRKSKSYNAEAVGTEFNDMPHVEGDTLGWYEAIWPDDQSINLKAGHSYWLHIYSPGYTQRLIECLALYRGNC